MSRATPSISFPLSPDAAFTLTRWALIEQTAAFPLMVRDGIKRHIGDAAHCPAPLVLAHEDMPRSNSARPRQSTPSKRLKAVIATLTLQLES